MSVKALGLLAAMAALLAGCGSVTHGSSSSVKGSGKVVTVSRDVPSFTKIELRGAATISVTVGKKTAVAISGDDNIVPLVHTEVNDGTLVISQSRGYSTDVGLDVRVSTPELVGSSLSGAGSLTAHGIRSQSFTADVAGAGRLDLAGTTGSVDLDVAGVGAVELGSLVARVAHVTLSGTGSVHVYASGTLDATVNGVGSIHYSGNPAHVKTHVHGLGAITAH
jgi:putative autotransporter adhesin-like protein